GRAQRCRTRRGVRAVRLRLRVRALHAGCAHASTARKSTQVARAASLGAPSAVLRTEVVTGKPGRGTIAARASDARSKGGSMSMLSAEELEKLSSAESLFPRLRPAPGRATASKALLPSYICTALL